MALIVEDGTGITGANAYIAQATADAYHLARGNADWAAATGDQKDAAIIKATMYLDAEYIPATGTRCLQAQGLAWPRYSAVDADGFSLDGIVPEAVKQATAELALRALAADIAPDTAPTVTKERIGEIEIEYDPSRTERTRYTLVERILERAGLLNKGCSIPIVRC